MPDLHDAFSTLAERHAATDAVLDAVGRRAGARRRHRTIAVSAAVVVVLVLAAGSALALRPAPSSDLDVAGTAPTTGIDPVPATAIEPPATFAPDDLRSVLPTPERPVPVRARGTVVVTWSGGERPTIALCLGPRQAVAPPSCPAPRLDGVEADVVQALPNYREMVVARGTVGWAPAVVDGWFDGTAVRADGPLAPPPPPPGEPVSLTSTGPGGPATVEQSHAVINDLMAAGWVDLGGLGGGGGPHGVTIHLAWADQALVDRLAARHPGITIILQPDMSPT